MLAKFMLKSGKRGWIKVVEAFMAIMMLLTIIFVIINVNSFASNERSDIEKDAFEILMLIANNDSLRELILNTSSFPEDSTDPLFPSKIRDFSKMSPANVECYFRICQINEECLATQKSENEIYAKDILITNSMEIYNPKKIKIFCSKNEI